MGPTDRESNVTEPMTEARSKLSTAAAITRSGARRYPRELMASLRRGRAAEVGVERERAEGPISASWLGHATVLLKLDDRWVLTDPVFAHRIGVGLGPIVLGVERRLPTIDLATLPPIDVILLSHAHFDHLDKPTLKRLASGRTRVVTAASTRGLVPRGFGEVVELPWEREVDLDGIRVRAGRPRHWGARTAWDRHRGFNCYVIGAGSGRVLYAGDTAYTTDFAGIVGPGGVDLSIFGIGAYDPWIAHHANPEQVWAMHTQVGGRYLLPMHHSTFKLSDEPVGEPMERLLAAAGAEGGRVVGRELAAMWALRTHA